MLLLVPAGVLIVIALGAMAVNAALLFQGERRAANVASSVANDVATLALDVDYFRAEGEYRLQGDVSSASEAAVSVAMASSDGSFVPGSLQVSVVLVTPQEIRVTVTAQVEALWNAPGLPRVTTVEASATATAGN